VVDIDGIILKSFVYSLHKELGGGGDRTGGGGDKTGGGGGGGDRTEGGGGGGDKTGGGGDRTGGGGDKTGGGGDKTGGGGDKTGGGVFAFPFGNGQVGQHVCPSGLKRANLQLLEQNVSKLLHGGTILRQNLSNVIKLPGL